MEPGVRICGGLSFFPQTVPGFLGCVKHKSGAADPSSLRPPESNAWGSGAGGFLLW